MLKNKVALITGAAHGIGKETALLFSKEGAIVIVVDIDGAGESVVSTVKKNGGEALYINANLTRPADCQNMVDITLKTYGQLNVLFNNAGILHLDDKDVVSTTEKAWDMTMSINVKSIFLSCKYTIPALIKSGGGSIINSSSFVAFLGSAYPNISYTASKGAILALTRELALTYAKDRIRVNAICPGPIATEAFDRFIQKKDSKIYLDRIPLHRFGTPDEVAKAIMYLASDNSSFMTGSSLILDGGITAGSLIKVD